MLQNYLKIALRNLLSKDFLKLVILSLVIATPLAWCFMSQWLEDFASHRNVALVS